MTTEIAYKFLAPGREPYHGGIGAWPEPGVWAPKITRLVPCERGYHLCEPHHLLEYLGPELWRVEWRGERLLAADKFVVGQARLLERVARWDYHAARLFACDCAEHVVRLTGPDERCVAALAVARRYALGEASEEELAAAAVAAATTTAAARAAASVAVAFSASSAYWAVDAGNAGAGAAASAALAAAAGAAAAAARSGKAGERSWQRAWLLEILGLAEPPA